MNTEMKTLGSNKKQNELNQKLIITNIKIKKSTKNRKKNS